MPTWPADPIRANLHPYSRTYCEPAQLVEMSSSIAKTMEQSTEDDMKV